MKKRSIRPSGRASFGRRRAAILLTVVAAVFALLGVTALIYAGAATYAGNKEAETATLGGKATTANSNGASGGTAVRFGGGDQCNSVPVGPRQLFLGDYSTGNFSQWSNLQNRSYNGSGGGFGGSYSAQILPTGFNGKPAARYEVRPGDTMAGGERSEVASYAPGALVHEGDERWYQFALKFDNDFKNPTGNWFIVMQWHSSEGSPPLAIEINRSGNLEISNNRDSSTVKQLGSIKRGVWTCYVLHTRFSNDRNKGFIQFYENGRETLPRTPIRNMADNENYPKFGIYKGPVNGNPTHVMYNAGFRVTGP